MSEKPKKAPAKRAPRKKVEPTKEEKLKAANDAKKETMDVLETLKRERTVISTLGLKEIPILVDEEIEGCLEEIQEIEEAIKEINNPTVQ